MEISHCTQNARLTIFSKLSFQSAIGNVIYGFGQLFSHTAHLFRCIILYIFHTRAYSLAKLASAKRINVCTMSDSLQKAFNQWFFHKFFLAEAQLMCPLCVYIYSMIIIIMKWMENRSIDLKWLLLKATHFFHHVFVMLVLLVVAMVVFTMPRYAYNPLTVCLVRK